MHYMQWGELSNHFVMACCSRKPPASSYVPKIANDVANNYPGKVFFACNLLETAQRICACQFDPIYSARAPVHTHTQTHTHNCTHTHTHTHTGRYVWFYATTWFGHVHAKMLMPVIWNSLIEFVRTEWKHKCTDYWISNPRRHAWAQLLYICVCVCVW